MFWRHPLQFNPKFLNTLLFLLILFYLPSIFLLQSDGKKRKTVAPENPVSEVPKVFLQGKTGAIWPIQTSEISKRLTSLFGESRKDHFHNGVDIASLGEPVRTMLPGRVIYSKYSEDSPFEGEWGSGNTVWMYHGNGVMSSYYHLSPKRQKIVLENQSLNSGDPIGTSGNTGHSSGAHLHFVYAENFGKTILDPLPLLPAVEDNIPPTIGSLVINLKENFTYVQDGDSVRMSQNFPLTIEIWDAGTSLSQKRGIASVQFKVNDELFKKAQFRRIDYEMSQWKNPEKLNFDELFVKDRYLIGSPTLKSGKNTIEVIAVDYAGNQSQKKISFFVNRI